MVDRSVVVRLRAEVAGFKQAMNEAAEATSRVGQESEKTARKATTALGKMVESAERNADSWQAVGRTFLTVGGAITALGTAALVTGVRYNQMQQTTRAALTTLLGSAEAANAQMDKLDAFARKSPFAKQTFISAQQQMLAFGIATQKVLPYLDAVQQSVAAMGGSNNNIAEIAFIMSQISAASKITATDLMQFGQRGINAAELIGSQMGMTGAQIRESITAGTLDAEKALDALAAGMQERYGGAADNVKETFAGALDRVKAAWRDLSAELAEPLVGQNGGGILVDLANDAADLMRAFQELPTPVKAATAGLTGVVGAAALAAGGFLTVMPKVIEFNNHLRVLADGSPALARGLGFVRAAALPLAGVLGAAAIGLVLWSQHVQEAKARTAAYATTLDDFGNRTEDTLRKVSDALAAPQDNWITSLFSVFGVEAESAIDKAKRFGVSIADMQGYILGQADAVDRVNAALETYQSQFTGHEQRRAAEATGVFSAELDRQSSALSAAEKEAGQAALANEQLGVSAEAAAASAQRQAEAAEAAAQELAKWKGMVADAAAGFIDLQGAYETVIQANKDLAASTAESVDQYLAELEKQVAAQQQWQTNMLVLSGRVSQGVIDELARLGPEGAPLVADLVNASDAELARLEAVYGQRSTEATGVFADNLRNAAPVLAAIMGKAGTDAANEAAAKLASGEMTLKQVVAAYDLNFEVDADTGAAIRKMDTFFATYNGRSVQINVHTKGNLTPYVQQLPQARGGVVDYYAEGGIAENHVAQIAPAGAWRVWAEPETGGEAYIPLSPAKRDRSLAVWLEVGKRIGAVAAYAAGGIANPVKSTPAAVTSPWAPSTSAGAGVSVSIGQVNTSSSADAVAERITTRVRDELAVHGVNVWEVS